MNNFKSFLLMTILTVLLVVAGGAIAGESGLYIGFLIAFVINFGTYWFSDRLAISMTKSKPMPREKYPEIYEMVKDLTYRANMPMPKLYIMPSDQPNAFATGRNPKNSAVAVTNGLLSTLNRQELQGVISHELAHIKNRDTLISTFAAVMAGALALIARLGMYKMMFGGGRGGRGHPAMLVIQLLSIIFAPLAAMLIKFAISRTREYQADSTGAEIAGNSEGLSSALLKLESAAEKRPIKVNEATSHMFIVNPLSRKGMTKLFSTHPPVRDRVKRLKDIR